MATRLNISVPDNLAASIRERNLPVSAICQRALGQELRQQETRERGRTIMIKGTREAPVYDTYTFAEQEFKDLLGISDPHGVLTVQVSFTDRTVTVTMSSV